VDSTYQEIALTLREICSSGYSRAWIDAEVGDDWDEQTLWCETAGDRSQPDMEAAKQFQLGRNLRKIRAQMTVPGQQPWSRCTFTLFPDGKFRFDVEYDD
jgi:hypothetical protein